MNLRILRCWVILLSALSCGAVSALAQDYTKMSNAELIDSLMQIDKPLPGVYGGGWYEVFLAEDVSGKFTGGVLGLNAPKAPPQARELVRRGPRALRELLNHVDDPRPTKLKLGNREKNEEQSKPSQVGVDFFLFSYFSDEYDPRVHEASRRRRETMDKEFDGRYVVKVGDICFALIGQVVNRGLNAARYQASGGIIVNSPIEAPQLAEWIRRDWGVENEDLLRQSLLADVRMDDKHGKDGYHVMLIDAALHRLRFYYPQDYKTLAGDDLRKRKAFEMREKEEQ